MNTILILGAGKIGQSLVHLFANNNNYKVHVADIGPVSLLPGTIAKNVTMHPNRDVSSTLEIHDLIDKIPGLKSIASCLPYFLNLDVAQACADRELNYFDLTEDNKVTNAIKIISKDSNQVFIPQCGLAPGYVSLLANHIAGQFDTVHDINMRVGALPRITNNDLKYSLTWSTNGLINECDNPCQVIKNGKRQLVEPMQDLEHIVLDGINYEAFNTSGGLGTLLDTYEGKVQNMNYKTMRYPGHRDLFRFLLQDLKLGQKREIFEEILNDAIPTIINDVVIVYVSVTGIINGKLTELSDYIVNKGLHNRANDLTAIQTTTACGIAAIIDIMLNTEHDHKGFVHVEEVDYDTFIRNKFGRNYIYNYGD